MARKTSWEDKYKVYKNYYREKQEKLLSKGSVMNERMLSLREFQARYDETKLILSEDVHNGVRKQVGNIYQSMISDQAYAVDYSTYNAIRKHNKELGQPNLFTRENTLEEIKKTLSDEFWEDLSTDYYDLKRLYGVKAAAALISQFYFGSD